MFISTKAGIGAFKCNINSLIACELFTVSYLVCLFWIYIESFQDLICQARCGVWKNVADPKIKISILKKVPYLIASFLTDCPSLDTILRECGHLNEEEGLFQCVNCVKAYSVQVLHNQIQKCLLLRADKLWYTEKTL